MKSLKAAFTVLCLLIIGLIAMAELNLDMAIREASTKETDGEIQDVLNKHGFRIDIYDEITPQEKIKALFR